MYLPRVSVLYSNGNLLKDIQSIDGIAGIAVTVNTVGLIGKSLQVFNLADAEAQGITLIDEPFAHRQVSEFYDEVGGNQEFWIYGTAETMTMAGALDVNDITSAQNLTRVAQGKIRLLGVCRKPDAGYNAGNAFFDADVSAALIKANTFGLARLAELIPVRILVEGRVNDDSSLDRFRPSTASVGFGGVVCGGSANDGSASVGTALGRAVKYAANIKIGKVANGPLAIAQIYIGTKLLKDVLILDDLHGSGVISFMNHPNKAGFFFGIDRMASTDDYRLLAFGRIVDKAAVICQATYVEELEGEVDVDANGNISETDIKHLESTLSNQISSLMGNQISGLSLYINPAQQIIPGSTLAVTLRLRPNGYKSFINVDLGLMS